MTVVIFEGCDQCGKSTQIKLLIQYLLDKPTHILHYTAIKGISHEEQYKYFNLLYRDLMEMLRDDTRNFILDRSHLGEFIYTPLYRPTLDTDYIKALEAEYELDSRQDIYLLVFIDSSFKNIEREDGDSISNELSDRIKEIELFKSLMDKSIIPNKIIIDIAGKDIQQVHQEIVQFLKTQN